MTVIAKLPVQNNTTSYFVKLEWNNLIFNITHCLQHRHNPSGMLLFFLIFFSERIYSLPSRKLLQIGVTFFLLGIFSLGEYFLIPGKLSVSFFFISERIAFSLVFLFLCGLSAFLNLRDVCQLLLILRGADNFPIFQE